MAGRVRPECPCTLTPSGDGLKRLRPLPPNSGAIPAHEVGHAYYRVVAATHLAWIASIFFLIPPDGIVLWPLLVYYVVLQVVRYWIILSLGRYWTHGIIGVPNAPIVRSGPYRYLRHPNYALTIVETFVLPLAFGALALAIIMTALWWTVLSYKIRLEDESLAERRANQRSITRK